MKFIYKKIDNTLGCYPDYPIGILTCKIPEYVLEDECKEEFKDHGITNYRYNKEKILQYADEIEVFIGEYN